ncbi:MAG: hypothetical protein R3F11_26790 [Verrucomicrobiales bacterium]
MRAENAALRAAEGDPSADPASVSLLGGGGGGQAPTRREKSDGSGAPPSETGAASAPAARSLPDLLAQRDPLARLRSLLAFAEDIPPDQIPGALEQIRESTPEWDPEAKLAAHLLLSRWGAADPDAALAYLEKVDFRKAGGDASAIISAIASSDPGRAVEWLDDPDNKYPHLPWMGHILAGSIAKEWVREDADAAIAWAKSVGDNQKTGALTGALATLAATDPKAASGIATELEPGKARSDVIGQIAKGWADRSPKEAIAWAWTLEGDDRTSAAGEALGAWAQSNPSDAAAFVAGLPEDQQESRYVKQVAGAWARQSPPAAAAWVAAQPDGEGKTAAMGDVMWNWTVANPQAASEWLIDQPAGPARDEGISSLAKATFGSDPAAAVTWANDMADEGKRKMSVAIGLKAWADRDAAAAAQWADQNGYELPAGEEAK